MTLVLNFYYVLALFNCQLDSVKKIKVVALYEVKLRWRAQIDGKPIFDIVKTNKNNKMFVFFHSYIQTRTLVFYWLYRQKFGRVSSQSPMVL